MLQLEAECYQLVLYACKCCLVILPIIVNPKYMYVINMPYTVLCMALSSVIFFFSLNKGM